MGELGEALRRLTAENQCALALYHEACAVLRLPLPERKVRIEAHSDPERLGREVTRIFEWRREQRQKAQRG